METVYQIDTEWRAESDSSGWALIYEAPTGGISEKTGDPVIRKDAHYYPTLKLCLIRYVDEAVKELPSEAQAILNRLNEIETNINNLEIK